MQYLRLRVDEGDVRLEAGDVLATVLALLLLLGVRLPLVVAHREEVVEGDAAHRAVVRQPVTCQRVTF